MNINVQFISLKDVRKKKKSKFKIIANIVILLFILTNVLMLYIGNIFYNKAFLIDTKKELDQYESNKNYFSEERFKTLQREEVSLTSKNNYHLYGTYIKNGKTTGNTIILVHDLGGSRWTMLKYVDMYLDKGFNVLIYDSRAHGSSGGDNISFGYYEQIDLDRWVNWLYTKNKGGIIGVHGDSMGAATALLHSKTNEIKKKVSFYIADSSYSTLTQLLTYKMKNDNNVKFAANIILFYSDIINRLKNNFSFKAVSPKDCIAEVTTPIMFIHGEVDDLIPKTMSEEMYSIKPGVKELYIVSNSSHGQAYLTNPEAYQDKVYKFIDTVLSSNLK